MRPGGIPRWLLLAPLLVACMGPPAGEVRQLDWEYRWGRSPADRASLARWLGERSGWQRLGAPRLLPRTEDPEVLLWLRAELPRDTPRTPAVALPPFRYSVELLSDSGEPVEQEHPPLMSLSPVNGSARIVRLPAGYAGRALYARVFSPLGSIGPHEAAVYGDEPDLVIRRLGLSLPGMAVGSAIGLVGLVALLTALVPLRRLPTMFGLWLLSLGLFVLSRARVYDVLQAPPALTFALWTLASALAPGAAVGFVRESLGVAKGFWTERIAWLGGLVFALITLALLFTVGGRPWHAASWAVSVFELLWPAHRLLMGWTVLWSAAMLVWKARESRVAAILLIGGVPFAVTSLRDVASVLGWYAPGFRSELHWGALSLAIAGAVAIQQRYREARRAQERYGILTAQRFKERESLMQDLHDGIGALTTNIRMLAEIGIRQGTAESRATFETIGQLAAESTADLRGVITGLDPELTYRDLASHLRELLRRLLEGRPVELRFDATLEAEGQPAPAVAAHVLSIYREALTNALRHADPSYVSVKLAILPKQLSLAIVNDGGRAPGKVAHDGGRGLPGMRRRANELGGSVKVDVGATTTLELCIPLAESDPVAHA